MKYKVIKAFVDLQDNKHVYGIGDEYPRKGYSPTTERVDELATGKNLQHKPLIQLIPDPIVVEEPETVVQVIVQESGTAVENQKEEQPKRKRGKKSND